MYYWVPLMNYASLQNQYPWIQATDKNQSELSEKYIHITVTGQAVQGYTCNLNVHVYCTV